MDEIRCEIRIAEVEGVSRITGVLMPYNTQAKDRAEVFERGSLSWDAGGIVLNRMHQRGFPILRFVPLEVDGKLTIDTPIPTTTAGADAVAEIRSGLFRGLSVEFQSIKERIVNGVRRISEGRLVAAGLVDSPAFAGATVEARAKAVREREWERIREIIL